MAKKYLTINGKLALSDGKLVEAPSEIGEQYTSVETQEEKINLQEEKIDEIMPIITEMGYSTTGEVTVQLQELEDGDYNLIISDGVIICQE